MFLGITVISILLVTAVVAVINRVLQKRAVVHPCAICAGVSVTWAWMLVVAFLNMRVFGYAIDPVMLAMLLGGSVVGIAFQVQQYLRVSYVMPWKVIAVVSGFVAVYSLIYGVWMLFFIGIGVYAAVGFMFVALSRASKGRDGHADELEEKMKSCC